MNAAYMYLQLYRLFDRCTPIKVDCGQLCGSVCCEGDDCGMYLFPGEKEVYKLLNPDWAVTETSNFSYNVNDKKFNVSIIFCKGHCDRFERPLACRIFPLTPHLDKNGKLEVIVDPRAKKMCPLARAYHIEDFEPDFVKKVNVAFRLLMKNNHICDFMKEYSLYIDDFLNFYK